jgi:hypothetical protein
MDAELMKTNELYREEITFFWGWLATILFFGVTALFIVLFFVQRAYGPIGENPAPDWLLLVFPAIYLVIAVLITNFTRLTISANAQGITAAYGRFRHFEPWDNIASIELDKSSALRSYGGWGIRIGWRTDGSVTVYNIMGAPTLLLKLKRSNRRYFGFSTRSPDEVVSLVNQWKK